MHTITILLGLVFCCMNPLVPGMCLIYFLINSLTEKYNMMYVMQAKFQAGGRARPRAMPLGCLTAPSARIQWERSQCTPSRTSSGPVGGQPRAM